MEISQAIIDRIEELRQMAECADPYLLPPDIDRRKPKRQLAYFLGYYDAMSHVDHMIRTGKPEL